MSNPVDQIRADAERLREERAGLAARMVEIDEELKPLDIALSVFDGYANKSPSMGVPYTITDGTYTIPRRQFRIDLDVPDGETELKWSEKVMKAVQTALTIMGPMRTNELVTMLKQQGIAVPGKDPEQNLSSLLSRKKEEFGIVADRRIGWTIKDDAQKVENPGATNTEASDSKPASESA